MADKCKLSNGKLCFQIGKKDIEINMLDIMWPSNVLSIFHFLFYKECAFGDGRVKLTGQSTSKENSDKNCDIPYQAKEMNIPAIKGWLCEVYRKVSRSHVGKLMAQSSKKMGELDLFQDMMLPEKPTYYPIVFPKSSDNSSIENAIDDMWSMIKPSDTEEFHLNTISDYITEYKNGSVTPLQVAQNVIAAIKKYESNSPKLCIILDFHEEDILKKATESTERWKEEKPLSVFDGIPVAVKDEIFLAGYPCCAGTGIKEFKEFITPTSKEGWMVCKMREGGAIFIGIANMHQLGMGVTGINNDKHTGTCRNPYNISYPCGGSSSGPAAAIASGLCPIALGADAGGSIRIPSSVCGVVGAKNTFGRISATGFRRDCDTVFHAGPLCATVQDARIAYGFLAGRDDEYEEGIIQPLPNLTCTDLNLKELRCGIDWNYFNDCCPEIKASCEAAVDNLVNLHGVKVVDISIPELQETVRAHCLTILIEMYSHGQNIYDENHDDIIADTEVNLMLGKSLSAVDYFRSQQQRTRIMNILKRLFQTVDCIITPTCGNFVPKLDADILKWGLLDMKRTSEIMRYSQLGNFSGIPSISVPVGYSSIGLPIGIQIQTEWWNEDLMYKLASVVERNFKRQKPSFYYDVIHNNDGAVDCMSINGSDKTTNESDKIKLTE